MRAARTAFFVWLAAVAVHGRVQEAFSWAAHTYGFDTIQAWQAWIWGVVGPCAIAWASWTAWRSRGAPGLGATLGITAADLAGVTTFVTRAEALHYPMYAGIAWLAARGLPVRTAFVAATAAGAIDEGLQWACLDPARAGPLPDGKDMVLNALGAATGVVAWWITAEATNQPRTRLAEKSPATSTPAAAAPDAARNRNAGP